MELVIGIDENGLGPRLGPMVATAVAIEVERYDQKSLARALRRVGYTDSKDVCGFQSMGTGEARGLAVIDQIEGSVPGTFDELVGRVSLEGFDWMRSPCPERGHEPCWSWPIAFPYWSQPDEIAEECKALRKVLARHGVRIVAVRSTILCASRLNDRLATGVSKSRIDLHAFEELAVSLVRTFGREARIICGRVGMLKFYDEAFGLLSNYLSGRLEETDKRSHYRIPGIGEIEFTVDADRSHAPVALASLVGKLLREGFVERMNRYFTPRIEGLREASGYNDPVTEAFVQATQNVRKTELVPDRCFERKR